MKSNYTKVAARSSNLERLVSGKQLARQCTLASRNSGTLKFLFRDSKSSPRVVEELKLQKKAPVGKQQAPVNHKPKDYTQAAAINSQEAKNPTRLPFEPMYQQLALWQYQHSSCHVPRNCYDAPPLLDAWVRHLRRAHASGKLEQWKIDRLNLLGFEWTMGDVQAKWVNMYHQLRRFKAVHGHTNVPSDYRNSEEPGWEILARWLRRQAQLFTKAKLTQQQQDMLSRVGVVLEVPAFKVEQYTQLQGLNAHERKRQRRMWRDKQQKPNLQKQQHSGRQKLP